MNPSPQSSRPGKAVIFDTDIGIDDAMALLFLHYADNIDLKAITTRFGNASLEDVTRNALAVKELFGIDAPVYIGAAEPLCGRLGQGFPDHVHGKNGLGDIELSEPLLQAETRSAAEALVDLTRLTDEPMTLIAVGGLTNIADAIALDDTFPQRVGELIVMGGAFGYNDHRGNVSPVAEANIASDPLAGDIVFRSCMSTTIVGLDVTHEVNMNRGFIAELISRAGRAGQFIADISEFYLKFHEGLSGKYECPLHDSCAVANLLAPELFTTVNAPVRVVTEGIALGQTIHGNDLREYVTDAWDDIPDCRVCTQVDGAGVLALYLSTLARAGLEATTP